MAEEDAHVSSPEENEMDRSEISSLLRGARCNYRVFYCSERNEAVLDCRLHKPKIPYDKRCETYLRNLGLYQISQIQHCAIDRRLITALVERWRPETHTFHLPVGEFTVTLQDVSCLWGLPISGQPIVGPSDLNSEQLVESSFGPGSVEQLMEYKGGKYSEFRMGLSLLRVHYPSLRPGATAEEVARYTRAYIMDLIGSIFFPDASGDGVPIMYLRFLQDLERPQNYNWGAAVLAFLYRNLTDACLAGRKTIGGALLLMQHWSWTWFNVARPRARTTRVPFGGPDEELRPPYGVKWHYYKTQKFAPARSTLSYYRNEFENMLENHVFWQPYRPFLAVAPGCVVRDMPYWLARVPMLCFWIVSWHYPDRVMRQFGLYQSIPPPPPHDWAELNRLNRIIHGSRTSIDWAVKHGSYVNMWIPGHVHFVAEARPYDESTYMDYRRWFQQHGLYTVFIRGQIEAGLDRPLAPPRDSVEVLGYVPGGFRLRRMGTRSIQRIKYLIQNLYKRGTKKICKTLLRSHRDDAMDSDRIHEFEQVLAEEGLPPNVEEINSNEDSPPEPDPVHAPQHEAEGFRDFFGTQTSLGDFDYGAPPPTQTYREDFPRWTEGPGQSSNYTPGAGQGSNWTEGPGQSSQQFDAGFGAYSTWTGGFTQIGSQPTQDTNSEWAGRFANSFLDLNYNPFGDIATEDIQQTPPATSTVAPLHYNPLPIPSDSENETESEEEQAVTPDAPPSSEKGRGKRKKTKTVIWTPSTR